MKKAAFFDSDGVLLNMPEYMCKMYEQFTGKPCKVSNFPTLNDDFYKDPEKYKDFRLYFSHDEGYKTIKPIDGMVDLIKNLKIMGYDLYVVTAALSDAKSVEYRQKNLNSVFNNAFSEIFIVDGVCKSKIIKEIAPEYDFSMFIDDSPKNVHRSANFVNLPLWLENDAFDFQKEYLQENIKIAATAEEILKYAL